MSTVKFRVELEGAGQTAAGFDQVAAAGKNAVNQVTAGKRDLDQYGQTASATAAALRQVPAQFTDIVTGLASGQSPLTVLLQQGGQLKDMFGGVGNAAQALGGYVAGLINPLTLTAAAAAGLAVAFFKGQEESRDLERALINTGNAAATTAGELREIADRVADTTGATRGGSASVLAELTATGRVTAEMLEKVAAAAIALERTGGQAAADTAEQFAALGKDPVEALEKLDEQSHFLTATVLEQVQALVEQGRTADAARLAQSAYADALLQRIPQLENQLGTLQTAWRGVKDLAKSAWDAMLGVGRDNETTEQKLRAAQSRLAGGDASARGDIAVWQAKLDSEKQSVAAQEAANVKRRAELGWLKEGEQFRSKQQKMEAEIAKARELGVQAGKSEADVLKRIGEIREKYTEKVRPGGTRAARADPLDAELERLRTDLLASEAGLSSSTIKAIDSLTQALRRGKVEAAEYEKLLGMLLDKDSVLRANAVRDEQSSRAQEAMAGSVDNLRNAFGRQIAAASERDMPQAERELARSLRQVSEEADRAREALSQKAASLRTDDIPALEAYRQAMVEVARAEEEQTAWVRDHAAEQDRLNGLMSTGFDRAIKRYADSSRSVADETEEAFTRAFANMEDALMTFLTTGKLSFSDFARSLIADMARIELRALLTNQSGGGSGFGGIVQSALSGIMGLFGGGGSSPLPGSLGAAGGLPLPSFARGGAFGPFGPIEAFANGGILHQPTLFRFARGGTLATGLGGEAGPEAIMPLARDRSGRLGVRGGGGPNITVNVAGGNGPPSLIRANAGRGAREVLSILSGARRFG
jgi:lambda family phage tail tape measure protein